MVDFALKTTLRSTLVASGLAISVASQVFAQSTDSNKRSEDGVNNTLPRAESVASVTRAGKTILIHQDADEADNSKYLYFHRPVFAFEVSEDVTCKSKLLWECDAHEGFRYAIVRLQLSSPELIALSKVAIKAQDTSLSNLPNNQDVRVQPWPLKEMRLKISRALTGEVMGETVGETLKIENTTAQIAIKIAEEKYERFIDYLNNDKLLFHPSYTYENLEVAFAQSSTAITALVRNEINNLLKGSRNQSDPILQEEAEELRAELRQTISQTILATNPAILANLPASDVSSYILKPAEVFDFRRDGANDPKLLAKIEGYLKPVIEKVTNESVKDDSTTNTKTDENTKKLKVGASSGPTGKGVDGEYEITDKDINVLETKHGLKVTETSEKDVYEPSEIAISFIKEGWQNSFTNVVQSVYVNVGENDSYDSDRAFGSSFTKHIFDADVARGMDSDVDPYSSVQPGMAFCYFGDRVPAGYVALDGSSEATFPRLSSWVPGHLEGQKVPDLRGHFLTGATSLVDVGKVQEAQSVRIPAKVVPANGLSLAASHFVAAHKFLEGVPPSPFTISNTDVFLSYYFHRGSKRTNAHGSAEEMEAVAVYNDSVSGSVTVPEELVAPGRPLNTACTMIMRLQ